MPEENGNAEVVLGQGELFEPDRLKTPKSRNKALAALLTLRWKKYAIVCIKRIAIGDSGWYAKYRK